MLTDMILFTFILGYSLYIEPSTSLICPFSPIQNSNLFLIPTWNQFKSLKDFTACVIQSDQISISYFVISCSTFIQSLPKFQHFIKNKVLDLPTDSISNIKLLPFPLTRLLQLLYQKSFWDELLLQYFKEFHPMNPLFSIQLFNQKTATPTLLNAMYYCAYQSSKNCPYEITEYMDKLADQNIKKIVKNASIDNVRALIIHTILAQWGGNLALAKSLQAHPSRMCYLLRLHLNYNKLLQSDCYNRDILFCMARSCNIGLSSSYNFTPSYIESYKKPGPYLYDKKWQLLELDCSTLFFKFVNVTSITIWFPILFKLETNSFHKTWTYKIKELKELYESTAQTLDSLKEKYYLYKSTIAPFETMLKMTYHEAVTEMYELLKHKNKILQPTEISIILDHCHELYHVLSTAEEYSSFFQFFAHVIGLHYLNIYPKCSSLEKQRTKQRLLNLLLFMKDKFHPYFSLNYLLLKTGYNSLDEN
ncbi:hypothetical protein CONCODRAFT_11393 [Conidiobolus coronatus NRRL 28638]|uniref:BTB domain-containing protein n=1 Tax=Conidiobolus coronatus (strain ATCC 28846 / CBS 209.66 / NRRL 28638) TaxID=796925 RepID=A0A137NVA4_CONC2|nr:hypothetical protein CONCODRAFT_11393 [Conidiobolus coronatus NRRL 28638]|eukprot:KXN66706.1 hypothetical protein CONCODRAFT_11393 [Conidiobolus coronatus NRRL 28638]